MTLRWKIYYGDGSTFCDEEGTWEEAPGLNVQAVVTEVDDVGWELNEGSDGWLHNYVWWPDHDRPYGVDQYGTLDYLVETGALAPGDPLSVLSRDDIVAAGVKVGRTIDTPRFQEIHMAASRDDYFPTKSARTRKERRG